MISGANFLRPHFKLNVSEGDMVSFTEAFLLLAREGGKDFEQYGRRRVQVKRKKGDVKNEKAYI